MTRPIKVVPETAGTTQQDDSTNTAQNLPDGVLYKDGDSSNIANANKCSAVFITCEDNPIRYAFNTDPTNDSGTGLGHILAAGEAIRLASFDEATNFKFISQVAGSHGTLQMTAEY